MLLRRASPSSRRACSSAPSVASWRPNHHASVPPKARLIDPQHPAFHDLSNALAPLPEFSTRGDDVRVIYEPTEFYSTLLYRISQAKTRIFIASLYVGKEEGELMDALRLALSNNPELKVTILLDYLRSTRETPAQSSASLVATLVAAFPRQVELRLYHTPDLTGWTKRLVPRRFDEGWGLQHMKCYGFDDHVMLSGANVSNDYFTNRQDRYIEFLHHPPLADYFSSLLQTVSSYSFLVSAVDTTTTNPTLSINWPSSNPASSPLSPKTSVTEFKSSGHQALCSLTKFWRAKPVATLCSTLPPWLTTATSIYDTTLRPVLQMGPFSISQETDLVVPAIFQTANSLATAPGGAETTIDWTSGYFSVQPKYKERVLDSRAAVRIVTASPEANGFFGSRGVSKYIPPAYTHLQKTFYDETRTLATRRRRETHIELREWKRPGWTYHAKGIWLTPSISSMFRIPLANSHQSDDDEKLIYPTTPFLTLIGSSNYGLRSAHRDLEANVLVTTFSPDLRRDLQEEITEIRKFAVDPVDTALFSRSERKVGWGVKIAAKLIEDKL